MKKFDFFKNNRLGKRQKVSIVNKMNSSSFMNEWMCTLYISIALVRMFVFDLHCISLYSQCTLCFWFVRTIRDVFIISLLLCKDYQDQSSSFVFLFLILAKHRAYWGGLFPSLCMLPISRRIIRRKKLFLPWRLYVCIVFLNHPANRGKFIYIVDTWILLSTVTY